MKTVSDDQASDFAAITQLSSACVHCGFCLAACPTYAVTGMENDSPRGRIWLLAEAARSGSVSDVLRVHIDRCIGCEACVPACQSGVRYDELIDIARRVVNVRRPKRELLVRSVMTTGFARASRLGRLVAPAQGVARALDRSWLLSRSPVRLPRARALVRQAAVIAPQASPQLFTSLVPNERARVALLTGCIAAVLFKEVNLATVKVLNAEGISVVVPRNQGCCGALASHAGQRAGAQRSAGAVIEALDVAGVDAVITNSAGCGAMMKDYTELLGHDQRVERFSSRVADVLEYLDRMESIADYKSMPRQVLYHDPCHLKFAQAVGSAPLSVIRRIPDIDLRSVGGPNCCGAGGLYSLAQPELARQVGEAKRDAVLEAGADLLLSGNPGCAIQLQTLLGDRVEVVHPIELLARALRQ